MFTPGLCIETLCKFMELLGNLLKPHFSLLREDLWCHSKPNPGLSEEVTPAWRSRDSPEVLQRFPRGYSGTLEKDK